MPQVEIKIVLFDGAPERDILSKKTGNYSRIADVYVKSGDKPEKRVYCGNGHFGFDREFKATNEAVAAIMALNVKMAGRDEFLENV